MKKIIASLSSIMLVISLTSCGYQGGYRYPCQDSANWDKAECNPPICEPSGSCSKDLVGEKVWSDYQASKGKNNG
jgi:predicted small lipoprotein YifL